MFHDAYGELIEEKKIQREKLAFLQSLASMLIVWISWFKELNNLRWTFDLNSKWNLQIDPCTSEAFVSLWASVGAIRFEHRLTSCPYFIVFHFSLIKKAYLLYP